MQLQRFVAPMLAVSLLAFPAVAQDGHAIRFPIGDDGRYGTFVPVGSVSDAGQAADVARAVLKLIYGATAIQNEEPFVAMRTGNTWTVAGTLRNIAVTKTFGR